MLGSPTVIVRIVGPNRLNQLPGVVSRKVGGRVRGFAVEFVASEDEGSAGFGEGLSHSRPDCASFPMWAEEVDPDKARTGGQPDRRPGEAIGFEVQGREEIPRHVSRVLEISGVLFRQASGA